MASYAYTGLTGGNWSTSANWTNMATNVPLISPNLPTSADDCYLHNKTVVIDAGVTVNVNKISNKATTGFTLNATAGGSATVALITSYCPTITVGPGGIESSQATTAGNTIAVSGTTTTANVFQILCSGDITGGFSSGTTSHAIYITATNTKITITSNNITGGITGFLAAAIYNNGAGNTIYINNTTLISGSTAAAVISQALTGSLIIKSTTITGGSSFPAILFRANGSNSSTQYIGYTWNFATNTETASAITDINASATAPAIQSINTQSSDTYSTTPILVQVTNLNGSSQGYIPILSFNAKITATNIKYYNTAGSLVTYQNQTPSATTVTEASIWGYLTTNAEFSTTNAVAKLIKDNLNATVSSRAVAGDAMTLTTVERTTVASSVWSSATRSLTTFGTLIADIWAYLTASATTTGSIGKRISDNLDTNVSSRLASASYTAPDNTTISTINTNVSAVKTKTDNLPANTATQLTTIQTATDRIPTNPASVQSTGDQIATLQ